MKDVTPIEPNRQMTAWGQVKERSRRRNKQKKRSLKNQQGSFVTLSRMADETHSELVSQNSPIRLCIYQSDDELFMDVVSTRPRKKPRHFSRSIGNERLNSLVREIHSRTGVILDYQI